MSPRNIIFTVASFFFLLLEPNRMLVANKKASKTAYPDALRHILNRESADESRAWLSNWSLIDRQHTPLWELAGAASHLGIARLCVKDESMRSPLGSFKALGEPIALMRLIMRLSRTCDIDPKRLVEGGHAPMLAGLTVVSTTDGNHGRALAAAAQSIGCQCVIMLHANVSEKREQAIAACGARIMRIEGNYEDSVAYAARLAKEHGWHVVSDTSYEGYEAIPRDVMQGLRDARRRDRRGRCPVIHPRLPPRRRRRSCGGRRELSLGARG